MVKLSTGNRKLVEEILPRVKDDADSRGVVKSLLKQAKITAYNQDGTFTDKKGHVYKVVWKQSKVRTDEEGKEIMRRFGISEASVEELDALQKQEKLESVTVTDKNGNSTVISPEDVGEGEHQ